MKSRCQQGHTPSEICRGVLPCLFLASEGLLLIFGVPWFAAASTPISNLCVRMAFSLCASVSSLGPHLMAVCRPITGRVCGLPSPLTTPSAFWICSGHSTRPERALPAWSLHYIIPHAWLPLLGWGLPFLLPSALPGPAGTSVG